MQLLFVTSDTDAATLRVGNFTGEDRLRVEVLWKDGSTWYPLFPGQVMDFSSPWNRSITGLRWVNNGKHYTWRVHIASARLKKAWCQLHQQGIIRFQLGNTVQQMKITSDEDIRRDLGDEWSVVN